MAAMAAAGATPAHAAADRCSLPGARVLGRSAQGALFLVRVKKSDNPRRFYGCLRGHAPRLIAEDYDPRDVDAGEFNGGFLLAGRTVAWHEFDFDGSGYGSRSFSVHLLTLGGGRHADITTYDDDNGPHYGYPQHLALGADGALAFAVELDFDYVERSGTDILALPAGSTRLVALGFTSDAVKSLRVAGRRVRWREKDGTPHGAPIRPARPPLSPPPSGRTVGPQGLDPRFGPCGFAFRDATEHQTQPGVLAAAPGGGVFAAVGTTDAIVLNRLTADGAADPAFGTGGTVTTTLPAAGKAKPDGVYIAGAVGLPDGGVVLRGGQNFVNGTQHIHRTLLVRYDASGKLEPAFGQGGIVRPLPLPKGDDGIQAVAPVPDGGLIVASGPMGHVLHLRPDGTADPAFGSGGSSEVPFITPDAIAVAQDGTINVAGAGDSDLVLVRFGPDGMQLSSTRVPLPGSTAFGALAQLPDGGVLVAGSLSSFVSDDTVLVRFTADGKLDTAFGRAGIADDRSVHAVNALLPEADGGWLATATNGLARYTADGRRDASFGHGGLLRDPGGGFHDLLPGLDGTVLAASPHDGVSALVRFAVGAPATSAVTTTAPACEIDRNTRLVGANSTTDQVHVRVYLQRPGTFTFAATLLIGSRTYPLKPATLFFGAIDGYDVHWPVGRTARRALARARKAQIRVTFGDPGGLSTTKTIRLKG